MESEFTKQHNNKKIPKTSEETVKDVLNEVLAAYSGATYFDQIVGYVGSLREWSVSKRRPPGKNAPQQAALAHLTYADGSPADWGLQYTLSGILSVYYEGERGQARRRLGFTGFAKPPSEHAQVSIPFEGMYLPKDRWEALG